jgi:hypothetical protein
MNETDAAVREILEKTRAKPRHVVTKQFETDSDSFFRRIMERVNDDIRHRR